MKLFHTARRFVKDLVYLRKTYAPWPIVKAYLHGRLSNTRITAPYRLQQQQFKSQMAKELSLSNDWFTDNAAQWLSVFEQYQLPSKKALSVLEIGSWQGLSSYFVLHHLDTATITCVDTWQGADEHKSGAAASYDILNNVEAIFDQNLQKFLPRLKKYKGMSYNYFAENASGEQFDLIYVDGSHHCDDVVIDAIACFQRLKVGGLMIFDDYFWKYYRRAIDNPAAAVNTFLHLKKNRYKIVRLYYQLIIEKTATNDTESRS